MKKAFLGIFIVLTIIFSLSGCGYKPDSTQTPGDTQITKKETDEAISATNTEATTEREVNLSTEITSSENVTDTKIVLDKTYRNDRFDFEFKYPGIWSFVEEIKNKTFPDHGAVVFIDNDSVSPTPIVNFTDLKDYIRIYGQVSTPALSGEPTGEFVTDNGVKGKVYFKEIEGRQLTSIVFSNENGKHGYGYAASVYVSKELYEKYKDVITRILKSIKLP
ncbi:MAG: hypothetical protein FIA99_18500 [Ruminiclostridium sp.]|nr:hypothetical protein [Ruminiclostridium sp.]